MVRNSMGYFFECRKDGNGGVGVLETFKVFFKGNEKQVTLTCTVDTAGHILLPAVNNLSLGFTPIDKVYSTLDELSTFIRSNKPFFGKVGEFALVGYGTVILNRDTDEILSLKNFNFYVPKTIMDSVPEVVDTKGNEVPALLCEKVSTLDELNCFKVSKHIYTAYQTAFSDDLRSLKTDDKSAFLSSLTFRGR